MIDVHSHIIPGIDDGSKTIETTLQMLKEASVAGFTDIIMTSHYIVNSCGVKKEDIKRLAETLQNVANVENINIKLHIGAEIYIDEEIVTLIKNNTIATLADSKYVLVELPMNSEFKFADEILFKIQSLTYMPIIAHPERYDYVQRNPRTILKWREQGLLMQCNYGSIIGQYGRKAEKTVKEMLKNDLVDFLGTDCHRPGTVYTQVPEVIRSLSRIISQKKILELIEVNPKKIIN